MAVMSRLFPLVAFSTFAIFLLALLATPTSALSNEGHVHVGRGHGSIAKRRRNPVKRAKRCRPKSSSPLAQTSTSTSMTNPPSYTQTSASTKPVTTTKVPTSQPHSTSSSAIAVTTPHSSSGGGRYSFDSNKKLLLAWPNGPTNLEMYTGNRVGGLYTWGPWCPSNASKLGINCFPQLWGTWQKADFVAQVKTANCGLIFGQNEPNQVGQSDMSPQDGAALWKSTIQPLRNQGCTLVSPATTSAPSGKTWIQDMMKACGSDQCEFDIIALHYYDTSVDKFKAYVDDWYNTFGKPIIISEYACQNFNGGAQCSKSDTLNFHYTMAQWFDQHPGVMMYAPFGFMHDMVNVNYDNQLMSANGSPNDLGKWYLYH